MNIWISHLKTLLNTRLNIQKYDNSVFTSSSSWRNLCNCASSWRLWSSSICIRASRRPLCWRRSFASANISAPPGNWLASSGVEPGVCLDRRRSYSACSEAFSSSSSLNKNKWINKPTIEYSKSSNIRNTVKKYYYSNF